MDEQEIGLHQFFGYIVNHVPEYREAYRGFLSQDDASAVELLNGFSGFVVAAWVDRDGRPLSSYSGDAFSRVNDALEMGLRSQDDELALMIVTHLLGHMDQHEVTADMQAELGPRTKELLAKKKSG